MNNLKFYRIIVKYKEEFLQAISESYLSKPSVIVSLMNNAQFSNAERCLIADNIPQSTLFSQLQVADRVVTHLAGYGEVDKETSFYVSLLETATTNENAIRLATKVIGDDDVDISDCNQILAALGESYSDLSDNSKNPKFEATPYNIQLLEVTKNRGIIISYKPYKDNQLRAYHGRK